MDNPEWSEWAHVDDVTAKVIRDTGCTPGGTEAQLRPLFTHPAPVAAQGWVAEAVRIGTAEVEWFAREAASETNEFTKRILEAKRDAARHVVNCISDMGLYASSPTPPTAPAALTALVAELGRWDRWVIGGTQAEKHGADLVKAKMIERLNAILSALPAQPNSSEGEPT
jgi:hypothetical protein